ncbi:MAG: hypothetical protein AAF081_03015 [Actinomycetota bacterium]
MLIVAAALSVPAVASAQAAPEPSPPDRQPTEDELTYYEDVLTCPAVVGYEIESGNASAGTFEFYRRCTYELPDQPGDAARLEARWSRPGTRGACGTPPATDAGGRRTGVANGSDDTPPFAAAVTWSLADGVDQATFEAASLELLQSARPLAPPCPVERVEVTCPELEGYEPDEDPWFPSGDGYRVGCTLQGDDVPVIELTVIWTVDDLSDTDVGTWLCSDPERSVGGSGQLRADGSAAIARYSLGVAEPTDLEPARIGAQRLLDQVVGQASSCAGETIVELEDVFTPLPPYLAAAFGEPGPDLAAEPLDTETPTSLSAESETAAAGTGEAQAIDDDGAVDLLLRIVSIVALVVSILGLVVSVVLIRRPTRVRPTFDLIRIATMVAVGVLSVVILTRATPVALIAGAVVVGGVLGLAQGRGLEVFVRDDTVYGRRSGISVLAFGAGVLTIQIAGLLQRGRIVDFGVALSALAAAIAIGLYVARRPKLAIAPVNVAGALVLVALGLGVVGVLSDDGVQAQDGVERVDPLAVNQTLIDLVDWNTIDLDGGLWGGNHAKPAAELAVPPGFDGIPDPLTRTAEWTLPDEGSSLVSVDTDYEITETFTFAARADGVCCEIEYEADGVRSYLRNDELQIEERTVSARLADIQSWAIDGEPGSFRFGTDLTRPPFAEVEEFFAGGEETRCGRRVAARRDTRDLEETGGERVITAATRDGESVDSITLTPVVLTAPCELPGYTIAGAIEAAPPPPESSISGCPVRQEFFAALDTVNTLPGVDTATVNDLYFDPNAEVCDNGALVQPVSFGQGGRGNQRHELMIDFAEPARGEWDPGFDRWFTNDRVLTLVTTQPAPPDSNQCEIDAMGVAVAPGADETCVSSSIHRLGAPEDHHYVTIDVDYSFFDGPNTTLWVRTWWGTYNYRCHHCTPGDPAIATFLAGLNDYGADWAIDRFADGEIGAAPGSVQEAARAAAAAAGLADDDLSEEDAALLGLLGALGVSAMAATTFLERGGRLDDLIDSVGERPAAEATPAPPPVTDEFGRPMHPDDDGLFEWDGRRLTRDQVTERIAEAREAAAAQAARHESFVDEHMSEAGVADRFDALGERSIAQNDELMQEIRDGWSRVDDMQTHLDERAQTLADLELAEAEQQLAESMSSWDQIARETAELAGRDVAALPGEIVDGMRHVTQAVADPENWRIVAETGLETIYDVAGMTLGGGSFGDGHESIANGARTAGQVGWVLATNPVDTVIMLSPVQNFADAVDGERTLGGRLVALGMGLVDIAGAVSGAGILSRGDDLVATARAVDAATQTGRTIDAASDAAAAARAARAGDAGLGAARVADDVLDPELLAARDRINAAILRAQQEAAARGVPVNQVLRELPEARELFQDGVGMARMGALEAAGGLSDEVAGAVVAMHDEITGVAARVGTENAIDTMMRTHGVRPRQVLLGNSGSVGAARSVVTDADRTIVTVFSDADLDLFASRHPGMTRAQAAERLQGDFAGFHQVEMELALNSPTDPAVVFARRNGVSLPEAVAHLGRHGGDDPVAAARRLTREQMDHASYSGMGSFSGQSDSYPSGFTHSRQSIQGSTEVYTVSSGGGVSSYSTSGQALIDQNELERLRHTGSLSSTNIGGGDLDVMWHDPTRIPPAELGPLLEQQLKAAEKYTDVKSVAKAVDRAEYVASRTGTAMADPALVRASVAIRADPRSTATVLRELGMTEAEFVDATKSMLRSYGGGGAT